jgi:glucan phosphoethanolaminetransferase (alkaline phosphatase superfamily)
MEQLVRFLFGHEQAVFTNGRRRTHIKAKPPLLLLLIALLIGAFLYWIYIRPRPHLLKRTTAALVALRAVLLILMARFCFIFDFHIEPSIGPSLR